MSAKYQEHVKFIIIYCFSFYENNNLKTLQSFKCVFCNYAYVIDIF